jgi:aryl-alcohol dehydrogenase-like predicted oxidoreductase
LEPITLIFIKCIGPDTETGAPAEETMRAMDRLVQDGKVRYVGVSNYKVEQLAKPLTVGHVDSLQPPYSILRSAIEQEILPFCQEKGIGVVAYSPLT